jgi:hypothetical protein
VRFFGALLAIALLCALSALSVPSASAQSVQSISSIKTAHGCAPPIPPAVPGSPAPATATPGIILINEVLLVPVCVWNCSEPPGSHPTSNDAWVELYNPQNQPFNLYDSRATIDTGPNTNAYYLPYGAAIAPYGFLVLFPGVLFSSLFPGTPSPEMTLRLVIVGVTIDQVTVPTLTPDQSYARIPDGGSTWELTGTPTIDASNVGSQTSTSSGASGSGSGGSGNSAQALANGTQPAWSSLTLPGSSATATSTETLSQNNAPQTASSAPTTSAQAPSDVPRRILLSVLVVALGLMLFWCWRLFTH